MLKEKHTILITGKQLMDRKDPRGNGMENREGTDSAHGKSAVTSPTMLTFLSSQGRPRGSPPCTAGR